MNDYMSTYIPYRKKQIIINTWHGGLPSKKVGLDIECSLYEKINIKNMAENTSYVLSPSRRFSGVMFSAFGITNDKMLNFGFPRNDIFFRHDASIARKVKRFYNIPEETGVILYAPTFRGPVGNASTVYISNPEKIIIAAEGRFQRKYVLLVRLHHTIPLNKESEFVLNGNKYPDVQELLYASDIVISDYSSIVWDFFFTKRPFFLYTPDTEEYTSARGFYIPVGQWGFPLAKTVPELIDNIGRFNSDDHSDAINNYLAMTGSYEQGNATRQCVEFIDSLVNKYQEESQ
jgi:CDP-glycerol glycerophosphotransferase